MKKHHFLIKLTALLFCLSGCEEGRMLEGYYDVYRQNENYPVGAYKFYGDGRCFFYKYNRSTGERYYWDVDDVIEDNTWSSRNDTVVIRGYSYKVVKQTPDTLLLKALGKSRDRMIARSTRQKDE